MPRQSRSKSPTASKTQSPTASTLSERQQRDHWLEECFPSIDLLHSRKVLLVGTGGIGCELVKTLVQSGFRRLHVVDLDTIDLTNLNRQFLFRLHHVGQSKSEVAAKAALHFDPRALVKSYRANIVTDARFDLTWFRSFDIVLNALDNVEARQHVNKMCLAANVPLVETGTAGLLGQATVHIKDQTECFDCTPKPKPVTFPVCTIRTTPSKPIHCVVWSKSHLFAKLFSSSQEEDDSVTEDQDADDDVLVRLREEAQALKALRLNSSLPDFAERVFAKVFHHDIQSMLLDEEFWKDKQAPRPLQFQSLQQALQQDSKSPLASSPSQLDRDHRVWTLEQSFQVFCDSCCALGKRWTALQQEDQDAGLSFDKDDEDTMDFVAACTNLRAHVFSIEVLSRFQIKEMAGNIIPAIATTNAVIAGLATLLAIRVLQQSYRDCKKTYLAYNNERRLLHNEGLQRPNPECAVCSMAFIEVKMDVEKTSVQSLLFNVIQPEETGFGMSEEVTLIRGDGAMIYDVDMDDMLPITLASLGVKDGEQLTIMDDHIVEDASESCTKKQNVVLTVKHEEGLETPRISLKEGEEFNVKWLPCSNPSRMPVPTVAVPEKRERETEDDMVVVVEKKRPRILL